MTKIRLEGLAEPVGKILDNSQLNGRQQFLFLLDFLLALDLEVLLDVLLDSLELLGEGGLHVSEGFDDPVEVDGEDELLLLGLDVLGDLLDVVDVAAFVDRAGHHPVEQLIDLRPQVNLGY